MIVLVAGEPFDGDEYDSFAAVMDAIHATERIGEVVCGDRPGVERLVQRWAYARQVSIRMFTPAPDCMVGRYLANSMMINYVKQNAAGRTMALLFGERGIPDLKLKVRRAGIRTRFYGRCS